MVEVRLKVWVTERDVQWVRVIRYRHQLRCRRLCRTSEIEETHVGIVIELVVQHGLRRPVDDLACIFLAVCRVVCVSRVGCSTDLGTELLSLVAEVDTATLCDRTVEDVA